MLKQGHTELFTLDKMLMDFEYLQGWRLSICLDNLSLCLVTITGKQMFPHIQEEPSCFHLFPLPLALSQGTRRVYCSSFLPPLGIYRHWCGSHQPSFLFFFRSLCLCITGEMLKFPKHLCGASPDSMPILLFHWGAQNLIQYFRCGLNRTWIISNATESISKTKTPKIMSGILKWFFLLCKYSTVKFLLSCNFIT